jgi:hypothetical protein
MGSLHRAQGVEDGMANGGSNGRKRIPWNKGRKDPRAGTPDSPWKATPTSGAGNGQGRRPGDRNKETIERGFRLDEVRDELSRREAQSKADPFAIFDKLFLAALQGDTRAAGLYLAYRFGKPKETLGVEGLGAVPLDGAFRCFLSDGRPLPAGPLPVPGNGSPRT